MVIVDELMSGSHHVDDQERSRKNHGLINEKNAHSSRLLTSPWQERAVVHSSRLLAHGKNAQ